MTSSFLVFILVFKPNITLSQHRFHVHMEMILEETFVKIYLILM